MINNLQILRAFAATSVALAHIIGNAKSYGLPVRALSFLEGWGVNGVDLFFVLSGFLMVYTQRLKPKSAFAFFKNRVIRIVPIYWFLTFSMVGLYLVLPSAFNRLHPTVAHVTSALFFVSRIVVDKFPPVSVGWTLEYEMMFYALFAVGIAVTNQKRLIVVPAVLLSALALLGITDLIVLEFVFGMVAATIFLRLKTLPHAGLVLCSGVVLLALSLVINTGLDRVWKWGVPSFLIVLPLCYLPQSQNRLGKLLGDASYSIYLIQVFTIPVVYKFSTKLLPGLPNDLVALICLALSVAVGVLVYFTIEKRLVQGARHLLTRAAPNPAPSPA